ncbi:MAG: DNA-3-methyladenine glycosylase 2 family protein [Proteobacteria bacterium]|nr:DNA-3-methyladenine glycosylase 2 family protein [Pseudomonadota bacterium]
MAAKIAPGEQPEYWVRAVRELARDEVMRGIMERHPVGFLKGRGDALMTLLRSITGQQISVKAADSVWNRFSGCQALRMSGIQAEAVLRLSDEEMRGFGFSASKVRYVRGVCAGFVDGTVHPGLWDGMSDEAVIAELVKLPGIGRWTAEMFLMFHLLRPDVLPVDDLGLVKGFKLAYGHKWKTGGGVKVWQRRLRKVSAGWAPYRSVAVWYLWRSLDPVEVSY